MTYYEVYAGSRPGRPRALLLLSAALLTGTLGLAWWQAQAARRLGPEQALPGTPLRVRVPVGWVASRKDPKAFLLRSQVRGRGGQRWEVDRYIRFGYENLGAFQPPTEALQALGHSPESMLPARIGPYPAVQLRQVEHRRWGRRMVQIESVVRATILPSGQLITVQYVPMSELTPADLSLLEEICAHVRVDDPALATTPGEALDRAGLKALLPKGSPVALPALSEVPGCYVGETRDGFPSWSFGLFRTWLAGGRAPRDLLLDFAASAWLLSEEAVEVRQWERADGAKLAAVRHPEPERNRRPVAAAWVLAENPREVLLAFVYTDASNLAPAEEALRDLLEHADLEPLEAIPDPVSAEKAGLELARLLGTRGARPWWGGLGIQMRYAGTTPRGEERLFVKRQPRAFGQAHGYQGHHLRRVPARDYEEPTTWWLGPQGRAFFYETALYWDENVRVLIREQRPSGQDPVVREITVNDVQRRVRTFQPGPGYVCPPLETLAEAWTAREATGPCLIETSTLLGRGTHTHLLRPLPPKTEGGPARVLVQVDYHPQGVIETVDEDYEILTERSAYSRYERLGAGKP